jgi:hypothetical protein
MVDAQRVRDVDDDVHSAADCSDGSLAETQDESEGIVDALHLIERQMADVLAECSRVDRTHHLAHHSRPAALHGDLGMEARRWRRLRCRADDDRRQGEKIVRLDDHAETTALLRMASAVRRRDRVHVTADHGVAP